MLRVVSLIFVLAGLPALAVDATVSSAPEPPRYALSIATASAVSLASSVAAIGASLAVPAACTNAFGSPRVLCSAAGLALGGAVQLALTALVLPEVFRLSGLEPAGVRAGWWRWARWPAAALAVAVVVYLVAASVEQGQYGAGQGGMIGGLGGTLTTGAAIDVLGVIGALRAARGLP